MNKPMSGITLVELMIAIVIGIIVVGVASSVLRVTMIESMRTKDAAMLQETTFFTSHIVEQHLRQIGFKGIDESMVTGRRIPVLTNTAAFEAHSNEWLQGQYLKTAQNSIGFRFRGASDDTGKADGSLIDCAGDAVAAIDTADITLSLTNGQLVCTSDGVMVTLVGSDETVTVERFVASLGIDDGYDGAIDRYVDTATATDDDRRHTREIVIRLLLASNQPLDASGKTYLFNGTHINNPDDRYRREVVARAALRNVSEI